MKQYRQQYDDNDEDDRGPGRKADVTQTTWDDLIRGLDESGAGDEDADGLNEDDELRDAVIRDTFIADGDPVGLYLKEIGVVELLTPEEEFYLATAVSAVNYLVHVENTLTELNGETTGLTLFRALVDALPMQWAGWREAVKAFDGDVALIDLAALTDEAGRVLNDSKTVNPTILRDYCDNGEWRVNPAWQRVVDAIYDLFLTFYCLPDSFRSRLEEHFSKQGNELPDLKVWLAEESALPSSDEMMLHAQRVQEQGDLAEQTIVGANLRLVVSVAKHFQRRGLSLMDLIQEGNIGLMRAVSKYEPKLGFRFSTYSTWWIRQAISRAISEQSRVIRLPTHLSEMVTRIIRTQHRLTQELSRNPTPVDLVIAGKFISDEDIEAIQDAEKTGVEIDPAVKKRLTSAANRIQSLMQSEADPISIDRPIGEDEGDSIGDFIEDVDADEPIDVAARNQLSEQVEKAMGILSAVEREVLESRFGLRGEKEETLESISRRLGLTKERIRQIEGKALRKLRHPEQSQKLRDYYMD